MTDNPGGHPQSGGYPPPQAGQPTPQGGYVPPPPPGGQSTPQGGYMPPQGGYPPPPQGHYPPPPPGGYPPPPQGNYPPPAGYPPHQGGGFPSGPAQVLPKESYTSWLSRVAAWFIDNIPVFIIVGIAEGIAILTGDNNCVDLNGGVACSSTYSATGTVAMFLGWVLALVYEVWNYGYRQGTTGSSIGKSVMRFKVVSEKTWQPIGFGMSVVRQIAHIVDSIICYIGYLFPLWDRKRQTLADKIMTTVCVPTSPQELPQGQQPY